MKKYTALEVRQDETIRALAQDWNAWIIYSPRDTLLWMTFHCYTMYLFVDVD